MADAKEPMLRQGHEETIKRHTITPLKTDKKSHTDYTKRKQEEKRKKTEERKKKKTRMYEICVLDYLKEYQEEVEIPDLKQMVKLPNADVNSTENKDGQTALHLAVLQQKADVVNVLLESGAVIKQDNKGNTPLHSAVQKQSTDIFVRLFSLRQTLGQNWDSEFEYVPKVGGSYHARTKTDCYMDMVTSVNTDGFNVLALALESLTDKNNKNGKIVQYIVREADRDCLLRLLRNNSKGKFSSPFRGLIKEMPELAKEVMDKCITPGQNEMKIFNYEFLDDTYFLNDWSPVNHNDYSTTLEHRKHKDIGTCVEYTNSIKKMKNNHPLKLMINSRRKENTKDGIYQQLLDHPLVKALVRRKWNHIGVKFHILNLVWYLIYLAVLTLCVSTTVPPYVQSLRPVNPFTFRNTTACQVVTFCEEETTCKSGNTCKNTTICHDKTTCLNKTTAEAAVTKIECHSFESNHRPMIVYMQYLVIFLSIIMIIKEVYQMVRMYGREYFKQIENNVELAVYISSVLFVVNVTDCENTDYRTNWQWVFGTLSVFMAWIHLVAYAKKFDRLGIYVMMLWSIIKTLLLNVFPFVAALLMAFALAFTCVHRSQEHFANVGHSFMTITYLMINGFDYEEFLSLVENHDIAFVSYIIYSLFQFLMVIAIINLMVGVAVENVQDIRKYASDVNTVLQIEYTLEFEGMICFISSKLRNICNIAKFRKWFILNPDEVIELTQLNNAKDKQDDFKERMDLFEMKMTKKLNTIKKQTSELNSIKDELRSINEALKLQGKVMTNTNK